MALPAAPRPGAATAAGRRGRGGPGGQASGTQGCVELRVDVRPPWPFELRGASPDGLFRRRGAAVQRLVHVGDVPVLVGAVQVAADRVRFGARSACPDAAREGIARLRFATGVDDDLREFHERFAGDEHIGRAVRARPGLRVRRRASPWEALCWAVTEQLIEFERACAIQRRMAARLGRRWAGLRDCPTPQAVLAEAPARLCAMDLAETRVFALRRCARLVASGSIDLAQHESAWRRLLTVPGIGPWTVEMLALMGQGRHDQIPAGDIGYLKLVGRIVTGNPRARADIPEVRGFFERYGEWKGLAGEYLRLSTASDPSRGPAPAGTRW